jgi:penicillin G amidase
MRQWFRRLGILLLLLLVLAVGYVGSVWYRATPQVDGRILVPGLQFSVRIIRDSQGVPHISARTFDDAILAQGYVTAQDRLWQMDLLRRLGNGELSQIFGKGGLQMDREQRNLGFMHLVTQQQRNLPATDLYCLQRYAQGVNAFLESHFNSLPVEFTMLRYRPSLWSPRDSLVLNLWLGKMLSTSWEVDLMREVLFLKLELR